MIEVLDHGFVRLVSYMQPQVPSEAWTGDLEVVRNARVSYDAEWRAGEDAGKDEKLINYLYCNRHTSPFEAMVFTFEVKAPIFVVRQWHRHRTWSYNEVSARYTELPEEYYVPSRLLKQASGNKQMSSDEVVEDEAYVIRVMDSMNAVAFATYKKLLERGVSRELARTVLPLSTYTRMFATVDLHNLLGFCKLRVHAHAQPEIRVYAEALLKLIEPICPAAVRAFKQQNHLAVA